MLGKKALKILAFSQPFAAIYFVIAGALRGAGDTKYAMYASAIGVWVARLGIGYILADLLDMALAGAWIAVTIDMIVRMVLVLRRFSGGVLRESNKSQ